MRAVYDVGSDMKETWGRWAISCARTATQRPTDMGTELNFFHLPKHTRRRKVGASPWSNSPPESGDNNEGAGEGGDKEECAFNSSGFLVDVGRALRDELRGARERRP